MKLISSIIFLIQVLNISTAQNQFVWDEDEYGISFSISKNYQLEKLKDNQVSDLWGFESDKIIIEIQWLTYDDESIMYLKDVEYAALEFALDMDIQSITKGGTISDQYKSYYVIGKDIYHISRSDDTYPVIAAVILDDENKLAFEITIDCYDNNLENGLHVIKSFQYDQPK